MTGRPALAGLAAAWLALAVPAAAQDAPRPYSPGTPQPAADATGAPPRPPILPADADYAFLDGTPRTGTDRLKRVPLGEGLRFSLSGLARATADRRDNLGFGLVPGGDIALSTRLNLYAGLDFRGRVRIFAAFKQAGRDATGFETLLGDDVDLALHQGFVELSWGDALGRAPQDALVRVGRQELHYGAGRMLAVREPPAARDDFDGALVRLRTSGAAGARITDLFAFDEVIDASETAANEPDDGLWGVYTSAPLGGTLWGKRHALDLYYIGQRLEDADYAAGVADETRHSLGLRWHSDGGHAGPGLSWDVETALQIGNSVRADRGADDRVAAWMAAGALGWGWDGAGSPTLLFEAAATSGDGDPADGTNGTFRVPHPPIQYYGETTFLAPGNLLALQASLALRPREGLTVTPGATGFWRLSEADGVYKLGGAVRRDAAGDGRFLGWEANLDWSWQISEAVTLSGKAGRFFANGSYLSQSGPAEDVGRIRLDLTARF